MEDLELLQRDGLPPKRIGGREKLFDQADRNMIQAPSARFATRKRFGIDQQNVNARFSDRDRGGRSGRAGADDDDVTVGGG